MLSLIYTSCYSCLPYTHRERERGRESYLYKYINYVNSICKYSKYRVPRNTVYININSDGITSCASAWLEVTFSSNAVRKKLTSSCKGLWFLRHLQIHLQAFLHIFSYHIFSIRPSSTWIIMDKPDTYKSSS